MILSANSVIDHDPAAPRFPVKVIVKAKFMAGVPKQVFTLAVQF
jgi:hypothetical protein